MVVKEDGTKWACQSCLKGHRVSGCTHTDRPLYFVPKKGRPVTQCQHCRVERKKRSAHVRCDCGERTPHHSKEKCPHLRNELGHHGDTVMNELGPVPEDHELEDIGCCCHHGGSCTCATVKRDQTSDSPDLGHLPGCHARSKPRLTTTQSDGHLTVFKNGHHKPVHRHNTAAHDNNLPYKMPRSQTDHGPPLGWRSSVDSIASENGDNSNAIWQRPTSNTIPAGPTQMAGNSTGNSSTDNLGLTMPQEQQSLNAFGSFDVPQIDGVDMSTFDTLNMPIPAGDVPSDPNAFNWAGAADSSIDWDNVDWAALDNFDTSNQPALTYASSNTLSEFGEHTPPDEVGNLFGNQNFMRSAQDMPPRADQPSMPSLNPSIDSIDGYLDQPNRWSLPASFWTGTNDVSVPISNSPTSYANPDGNHWTTSAPKSTARNINPALASTKSISALRSHAIKSPTRARPRAVYQKADTSDGTPGWEQLLQEYQAGNLWDTADFDQASQQHASTTQAPLAPATQPDMTKFFQRQDSDQFVMDPEPFINYDLNDMSSTNYDQNWAQ